VNSRVDEMITANVMSKWITDGDPRILLRAAADRQSPQELLERITIKVTEQVGGELGPLRGRGDSLFYAPDSLFAQVATLLCQNPSTPEHVLLSLDKFLEVTKAYWESTGASFGDGAPGSPQLDTLQAAVRKLIEQKLEKRERRQVEKKESPSFPDTPPLGVRRP
jgi:hypothetical protein